MDNQHEQQEAEREEAEVRRAQRRAWQEGYCAALEDIRKTEDGGHGDSVNPYDPPQAYEGEG